MYCKEGKQLDIVMLVFRCLCIELLRAWSPFTQVWVCILRIPSMLRTLCWWIKRRVPKRLKPTKTWIFIRCRRSDVKFSPFFMMKCIWFDHSLYICFFMYKSSASSMKGNDVYLISIRTNIFLFLPKGKTHNLVQSE